MVGSSGCGMHVALMDCTLCSVMPQEGHHAGNGVRYLEKITTAVLDRMEDMLPTLGRKLRLELEVPTYLIADIAPLLHGVLLGLLRSGIY